MSIQVKEQHVVESNTLSHRDMFTQILLMTLQSKTDFIDVKGLSDIIHKKHANPFVVDDDGNSLLHWTSWRKLPKLTKYLIESYPLNKFQTLNNLLQNPIHWSSMSGDIESIKIYLKHTDLSYLSTDIDGYNCLHSAAQLNQAAVFEFFLLKFGNKLDLNQIDNKGRTVFHWAVFKEHAIMIEWLLHNYDDDKLQQFISIQDVYGDTALHIAAKRNKLKALKSVISHIKNNELLYNLINVENLDKKTCIQIAQETENKAVYKLLNRIKNRKERLLWTILMEIYGNNDFFNDLTISTSTMKQIGFIFTIYFFVMQSGGILLYYFVFWTFNIFVDGMCLSLAFIAILLWLWTHLSDPGIITKPTKQEVKQMFTDPQDAKGNKASEYIEYLLSGETSKICITCRCVKAFRSKHCPFCNHCVKKFDHHCPWIDNCIGDNNYKLFVLFIIMQTVLMVYFLIFCIIYFVQHVEDISYILVSVLVSIWSILSFGTTAFSVMQIVSHIKLITNGYTTNEFINMLRYSYFRDKEGNLRNPFANGCIKNWVIFLCESCDKKLKDEKMMKIEDAPILAKVIQKTNDDIENQNKCKKHDHK